MLFARAKMPPARTLSPSRGIGALDLFTMKPNGDDQVRVVKTDALLEYGGHWSPNGARMTFAGSKGKGNLDIYTAMADGTQAQATHDHGDELQPELVEERPADRVDAARRHVRAVGGSRPRRCEGSTRT